MRRIRDRSTFERLRRSPVRARAGALTVVRAPLAVGASEAEVAFAVGRPVGSAVVRNRVRRQVRALAQGRALPAAAYLIRIGPSAVGRSHGALAADLDAALAALPALDGDPR